MDAAYIVSWFVGVTALLSAVRHVRAFGFTARGILAVYALVLAVAASGVLLSVSAAGWASLALWLLLVAIPGIAARRVTRFSLAQRYDEAASAARLLAVLHPFPGNREHARYLSAQSHALNGDLERARRLLEPLTRTKSFGLLAELELLRLDTKWDTIVERVERDPPGTREMNALPVYLRALGETGDVDRALGVFTALPPGIRALPTVRLLCAAFGGRPDWVRRLLDGPLKEMRETFAGYWLATAEQAAGDVDGALERLGRLATEPGSLGAQARYRMAHPLPRVDFRDLSETSRRALATLEERFAFERHFAETGAAPRRPVATIALMTLLGCVFLAGVPAGSTSIENLVSMGALVLPVELVGGEFAWRVVAAGFLHFGALHLLMNLIGLWSVGGSVERIWDGPRMLFVFAASSLGAFAFAPLFVHASLNEPRVLLGASAGVLGLVGALATFSAVGFFYGKNRLLRERLQAIGVVLAIQIAFDASTPMISSTLHVLGFAFGALAALPFAALHWRRARAALA